MSCSLTLSGLGKNPIQFATGQLAKQANGSVVVTCQDTVVLVTACMSQEPKPVDFLPLVVEYQEKTYAMGRIPGGYLKREGRPKDAEILCARIIDRSIRPLFPKGLTNEVQVVSMVLSSDAQNAPDVLALNAASCALYISDIPFDKPIGAVRVCKINDAYVLNPTYQERKQAVIEMLIVGWDDRVVMIEGECREASEEDVLKAIELSREPISRVIQLQRDMKAKAGKAKKNPAICAVNTDIYARIKPTVDAHMETVYGLTGKEERENAVGAILKKLTEELMQENAAITKESIAKAFSVLEEEFLRRKIIHEDKRPDGRGLKDIRALDCQVRVLPRTHGSGLFTRGQTQALAVTTLGSASDAQTVEALEGEKSLSFMLHYLFPPFATGEVKMMRGPGRREIGHGALAEKALIHMMPSKEEFPYTIRVVSEILESNGSSSMATVCASTLSLMDAGVPIKDPVAGIALGLVTEGQKFKVLTDLAGVEDHYGDMDFKIAGTRKGITAIQLDIKIDGLSPDIVRESVFRAQEARMIILDKIGAALATPREQLSQFAPKIKSVKIDTDKIGNVIGPGGKHIRKIQKDYNVSIDIEDDSGRVSIVAQTSEDLDKAARYVTLLAKDFDVGDIFEDARVVKIMPFGAFCELIPGKQGMVHVSEIASSFVKDIAQHIKEGDIVKVKIIGIDQQGKISLSIKQAQ